MRFRRGQHTHEARPIHHRDPTGVVLQHLGQSLGEDGVTFQSGT